jgi:cold shock CspA family protein/ribosome-associated translation inhibitor RaiA
MVSAGRATPAEAISAERESMDVPLEVSFDNIDSSEFVERRIRERVDGLNRIYDRLVACRVAVRIPHRQHGKGNVAEVRIEMSVPGKNLVVSDAPHHAKERYRDHGVYRMLDESFDVAERRLKDFKEQQRGEVKRHQDDLFKVGVIRGLNVEAGHGFLGTAEGGELLFHRNALVNADFDDLSVDDRVHYVEAIGEAGPQASRVWLARAG